MIWSISSAELYRLLARLESANNGAIKFQMTLEWKGISSSGGAADSALFDRNCPAEKALQAPPHRRVNFLESRPQYKSIKRAVHTITKVEFEFGVYRRPGNAYLFLPYGSYH